MPRSGKPSHEEILDQRGLRETGMVGIIHRAVHRFRNKNKAGAEGIVSSNSVDSRNNDSFDSSLTYDQQPSMQESRKTSFEVKVEAINNRVAKYRESLALPELKHQTIDERLQHIDKFTEEHVGKGLERLSSHYDIKPGQPEVTEAIEGYYSDYATFTEYILAKQQNRLEASGKTELADLDRQVDSKFKFDNKKLQLDADELSRLIDDFVKSTSNSEKIYSSFGSEAVEGLVRRCDYNEVYMKGMCTDISDIMASILFCEAAVGAGSLEEAEYSQITKSMIKQVIDSFYLRIETALYNEYTSNAEIDNSSIDAHNESSTIHRLEDKADAYMYRSRYQYRAYKNLDDEVTDGSSYGFKRCQETLHSEIRPYTTLEFHSSPYIDEILESDSLQTKEYQLTKKDRYNVRVTSAMGALDLYGGRAAYDGDRQHSSIYFTEELNLGYYFKEPGCYSGSDNPPYGNSYYDYENDHDHDHLPIHGTMILPLGGIIEQNRYARNAKYGTIELDSDSHYFKMHWPDFVGYPRPSDDKKSLYGSDRVFFNEREMNSLRNVHSIEFGPMKNSVAAFATEEDIRKLGRHARDDQQYHLTTQTMKTYDGYTRAIKVISPDQFNCGKDTPPVVVIPEESHLWIDDVQIKSATVQDYVKAVKAKLDADPRYQGKAVVPLRDHCYIRSQVERRL